MDMDSDMQSWLAIAFRNGKTIASLGTAVLMTIAMPIAIDQGYFRHTVYALPVLVVIVIALYILSLLCARAVKCYIVNLFSLNGWRGKLLGVLFSSLVFACLAAIFHFALRYSKAHVESARHEASPINLSAAQNIALPSIGVRGTTARNITETQHRRPKQNAHRVRPASPSSSYESNNESKTHPDNNSTAPSTDDSCNSPEFHVLQESSWRTRRANYPSEDPETSACAVDRELSQRGWKNCQIQVKLPETYNTQPQVGIFIGPQSQRNTFTNIHGCGWQSGIEVEGKDNQFKGNVDGNCKDVTQVISCTKKPEN